MVQFSKSGIQKLNSHLHNLKISLDNYQQESNSLIDRNFRQSHIFIKNKKIIKSLLIDLMVLNLETSSTNNQRPLTKIILNNKNLFVIQSNDLSYLTNSNLYKISISSENFKRYVYTVGQNVFLKYQEETKRKLLKYLPLESFNIKIVYKKLENLYLIVKNNLIGKWYIFLSRFFILIFIHYVPFIQLTSSLFYTQPNKFIVNPILCWLLNFFPFLLRMLNLTTPLANQDTFSFLLIGFYFQVFVVHFKSYKIPRKIAFQGTFALALMLLNYCMILNREILVYLGRFLKRFLVLNNQKIELLRDDFNFYIEDLEELRDYKERFLQLGESIFSLDNITKVSKIYEASTLIPLFGVIALLYNCMYFILRGQKPIIPIVTKTVQRMMIDRNGRESS